MPVEAQVSVFKTEANKRGWQLAVASSILGWVLDAFDFFVVVFLFDARCCITTVSLDAG